MNRYLCLDYGDKRIGVAISDETLSLANPLPFIANNGSVKKIAEQLRALITEKNVTLLIIGVPRNMDGSYGPSAEKARSFSKQLGELLQIEIKNIDERLSTVEASRRLHEAGKNARQQKTLIDSNSACVMLQSHLDSRTLMTNFPLDENP
ncbi:MAG: Holliday junction resolvase RuvX [Verrucomicrobiales bacterium]|jgi:putative Holliday junction resolvase|nr:Holliday junction resolvase RuvX [Verrucomicrobiales bacterium]